MLETHQIDKLKRLEKTKQLFKDAKVLEKLFWWFDFNRAKSQFVPLNQKLTMMPNLGIMVNFWLMLANYQLLSHSLFNFPA